MCDIEPEYFVQHLLAEHQRLDAMLRETWSMVIQNRDPDLDASCKDVELTLRQVRDELARHFAEEEAGGCLEEAATRRPHLSADEHRIELEHAELLGRINSLIKAASTAFASESSRSAFERDLRDFCNRVHAHETAENNLLRQAFRADLDFDCCTLKSDAADF